MLVSNIVITQFNLNTNICFFKYAHNSGPKASPDIILSALHGNVMPEKMRYLPGPATSHIPSYVQY